MSSVALLAGCSVPMPEQQNDAAENKRDGFNVVQLGNQQVPANGGAGGAAGADIDHPGQYGRIPPAFLGRWGLVPADCTSMGGDNKGLMTVESDRLTFYESRASVAKISTTSATEVQVTLAFSGEGQEWTQDTPLVLEDNGNGLTRFADGQTLHYTRCGA